MTKSLVKRLCHDRKTENRHREPDEIAEDEAGGEGRRAVGTPSDHPRDQGGDAGPRRCRGHEQSAGEQEKRCKVHEQFSLTHETTI
jgi:hypothetical protein